MDILELHNLVFDLLEEASFPGSIDAFVKNIAEHPNTPRIRIEISWMGAKHCFGPKELLGKAPPVPLNCRRAKATWWYSSETPNRALQTALEEAIVRLINVVTHMDQQAGTDWLTRLPNRFALEHFKKCHTCREWHWVALIDVDHLKKVNETRGYEAGDQLVKEISESLDAALGDSGLLFRLGGDEFLAVLSPETPSQALNVLGALARAPEPGRSVCIGAAWLDEPFDQALAMAEQALRKAKSSGPASIEISTAHP